ncbi:hypothetical protein NQ314_013635 [Rhamnusium bicolor]|uniref:ZAD domain-containing protein n=1 Tax=Rhamnusium bicolor TaxID=1586634 RepID=A0AAV8X508_9CUCU|nr:hypothetical protein NQ314_013635 [Rhamnusium bicolor]
MDIAEDDKLSKEICHSCLKSLTSYFKFRSICLENDKRQRDLYNEDEPQIEAQTNNKQKRKATEGACTVTNKKQRVVEEVFSDSENSYDENDDLESLSDFIVKKEPGVSNTFGNKQDPDPPVSPPPLVSLQKHIVTVIPKQSQSDIDKKFDKVEEELRRVLEGQLTEEQASAENIIIHVENDDEEQSPDKVATLSKLKLPIVIKPLESKKVGKKDAPLLFTRRRIIEGDAKLPMKVKTGDLNEVTLPKGINVTVKEIFKSEVGNFEGLPMNYVFNTEFCLIDGYLYEYRLCKGTVR